MITLISTPDYPEPDDPSIICRWLATESPNNFRLLRRDWIVSGSNNGGYLRLTFTESFTGNDDDSINVYDLTTDAMLSGTITSIDPGLLIADTDIPWVAGTVAAYMNDFTLRAGYYFEGRLTVNDVVYPLTIIASPDTFGYADLDVSGILRIVTSLGKTGDYTSRIMKETTKSGKFNLEYRERWYGYTGDWEAVSVASPEVSPPIFIDYYYAEAVRSEEQGSNLHEYVANDCHDAPFLNQFENPVYWLGLPFDISFILPELAELSPTAELTVSIKIYDSNNLLLSTITEYIAVDELEGFVNSCNIDQASIPDNASYMNLEITSP